MTAGAGTMLVALLALPAAAAAQPNRPEMPPAARQALEDRAAAVRDAEADDDSGERDESKEFSRHERQVRQGRSAVRRVLRDKRASAETKRLATDLQALLDKRDKQLAHFRKEHDAFLTRHGADVTELRELGRRAREIHEKLDTDRRELVKANESQAAEFKANSAQASQILQQLRARVTEERRARRQR
jgi:hypothetical protein